MKKTMMLLKKIGLGRVKKAEADSPFEKRLKKVNRTPCGEPRRAWPVFRSRADRDGSLGRSSGHAIPAGQRCSTRFN